MHQNILPSTKPNSLMHDIPVYVILKKPFSAMSICNLNIHETCNMKLTEGDFFINPQYFCSHWHLSVLQKWDVLIRDPTTIYRKFVIPVFSFAFPLVRKGIN